MKMNLLATFALILFSACGGDDPEEPVVLPSNLQVLAEPSSTKEGLVNVTATAQNANFYTIDFGISGSTKISTDGTEEHTYTASGTYTISVKAHTTTAEFISQTVQVIIKITDPVEPIIGGNTSPLMYEGMTLKWQDEFEGTSLNSDFWTHELGASGWGNNELQYYRPENTQVKDGNLIITARKETFQGANYTSSRIITKEKKEFTYGRVDIRAVIPKGQGIWPALWMLGSNISEVSWPKCGEIDIMEMIGGSGREKTVHGTIHWYDETSPNANKHANYGGSTSLSSGIFSDKYYVYSIEWDATSIKWFIDGVKFHEVSTTPSHLSEFNLSHFFIFNIAVGGNWPGNPDGTTVFPQKMMVDYIRVFQKN